MNGHTDLIAMRRSGQKPAYVWVNDYPCKTDWAKWGEHPTVCVAGDTPELLDLRFLVGTTVILTGFDSDRTDRIANACSAHAARVIASTLIDINVHRCECERVTDTESELTWPN